MKLCFFNSFHIWLPFRHQSMADWLCKSQALKVHRAIVSVPVSPSHSSEAVWKLNVHIVLWSRVATADFLKFTVRTDRNEACPCLFIDLSSPFSFPHIQIFCFNLLCILSLVDIFIWLYILCLKLKAQTPHRSALIQVLTVQLFYSFQGRFQTTPFLLGYAFCRFVVKEKSTCRVLIAVFQ